MQIIKTRKKGRRLLSPETVRIMKLTATFLLAISLNVSATGHTQNVTLNLSGTSLEKVFNQVRKQTGYVFFYKTDLLKNLPKVNVRVTKVNIDQALDAALSNLPLSYAIIEKTIVIRAKETKAERKTEAENSLPKDIEISGRVTTEAGEPLVGASVKVKGSDIGTVTNSSGDFVLHIPNEGGTLVISYVGYAFQEIIVNKQTFITIVLKQKDAKVDEVVVVGYGTVRKSDLTGAVSSVSAEKITQVKTVSTVAGSLQGQAAGVQVIQRSGQPGEGVSIKIRGTNSIQAGNEPLYVVDGVPLDNLTSQLNPSDIENIEVLKDASSTAIYGSRGANGVIMITTKKGREGKVKVSYNAYYGIQSLRKKIDLINAQEFARLQNEVAANDAKPAKWTQSQIDSLAGKGTDWQDLVYRNASVQNHNLSVSGGNAATKYYTSFGYYDQKGIIPNTQFKRFSFRSNLDQNINERLTTNISLSLQHSNYFQGNYFNADGNGGVPFTTMVMPPTMGIYDAAGKYTVFTGVPWGQSNPYAMAKEEYRPNKALRVIGNVTLTYLITDGLKLKLSAGTDNNWNKSDYYAPSSLSLFSGGGAFSNYFNLNSFVSENLLNYNKTFDKHFVDVVAGATYQSFKREYLNSGTATGFLTDIYLYNNIGASTVRPQPSNSDPNLNYENKLVSFLGRVNYTFAKKYLLTLTGRYDGSSKFSKNDKFAFFPSGAIGWKVSNESFMQNLTAVSNLKLRASYGVAGNQAIPSYQTLGQLSTTNVILNNSPTTAYFLSRLENNLLKWESTKQFDLGMDLGLFNDRLQLTADYYNKKTTDLLLNVTLPTNTGFNTILKNVGKTGNKGFEFQLEGRILTGGPLTWNSTLTFTSNKTKLLDLGKNAKGNAITYKEVGTGGNWFPMILGQSMQQLYGLKAIGVYQTDAEAVANGEPNKKAGDYKYKDSDGDGVVDPSKDRIVLSHLEPKFSYGFNNSFAYKNFNLSFLIVGTYGNDIVNEFRKYSILLNGNWVPTREAYENRWIAGKGPSKFDKPGANSGSGLLGYASSLWVEDGSYMRVRDITLAYNFTAATLKRMKISSLELYISGQNLITITNYSGYDPEAAWQAATINGWDRGNYPSTKSVTGGVKVNF